MSIIWLIAFLGLLLLEFLTVGLVSIWFAVGALAAMLLSLFVDSVLVQFIVFIVVSVITLFLTKPLMKKFKSSGFEPTNTDRVIGKIAEVTKEITPNNYGEVVVFGTTWMAASNKKQTVGSKVVVDKIDGAKLIVKREGEE